MIVLGIDPGASTGWCLYSTRDRRVLDCGEFDFHGTRETIREMSLRADVVVIESLFQPRGNIYPPVVQSAIVEGRLQEAVLTFTAQEAQLLSRHDVKLILTAATQRTVVVTDDKTAWQALVLLHGEGSDRKPKRKKGVVVEPGGALGSVTGHARAALAVAVAWSLRQEQQEKAS